MAIAALFLGHDFDRALRPLDAGLKKKTFATIRRVSESDTSVGLNDELLGNLPGELEVRSARVTLDERLIFAKDAERIVVLWVDKHDQAYAWKDQHLKQIRKRFSRTNLRRFEGSPALVPRMSPEDPVPVPDPDLLDQMAERGFEHYFAFLDDDQRFLVEYDTRNRKGLSFVKAGAGTGKTSIAIWRALRLAAEPELDGGRVLYLCYNRALMLTVQRVINALGSPALAQEIEVNTFHGWAESYLKQRVDDFSVEKNVDRNSGWLRSAIPHEVPKLPADARGALAGLSVNEVVQNEIEHVLSPNQFDEVEPYLNLGRPESQGLVRLRRPQRQAIWELHQRIRQRDDALDTWDDLIERARATRVADPDPPRYRAVIVDEGQDCSPVMARMAKVLVAGEERRLLVLADPAQELYPGTFLWAQSEFKPRGSQIRTLLRPYRSTRQIHALAASLYANVGETRREISEMAEAEREGPLPRLARFATVREGLEVIVGWIRAELAQGRPAGQIAVLTGSNSRRNPRRDEARAALEEAGVPVLAVDRDRPPDGATVSVATVNAAKGLDFTSVYLLDPGLGFGSPDSRRARFYVALTRSSRNLCIVCCNDADSPLLDDLDPACYVRIGEAAA